MIKEIITISNDSIYNFNMEVRKLVASFQKDGLKVDVQFKVAETRRDDELYVAMIIGREKQ
jgi:hypothetical protein